MMKKIAFFLFCIVISSSTLFSQEKIDINRNRYTQNGRQLRLLDLEAILQSNSDALHLLRQSKTNEVFSYIFSLAGGFMFGYELFDLIRKGPNGQGPVMAAGIACIGISIPFAIATNKRRKEAVLLYNESLEKKDALHKISFHIVGDSDGLGLAMRF